MHMSDPDDGMFKNSGMPSCGAGLGGDRGGAVNRAVCGILFALSLVLRIKVPVLPVKNEITLTGGGLSKLLTACHIFTTLVVRLNCDCRLEFSVSYQLF